MDKHGFNVTSKKSCLGLLASVVILVVISTLVTTIMWGWIVPRVLPGAVDQGVLPESVTFFQAIKMSILISVFGLISLSSVTINDKKESYYKSFKERILTWIAAFILFLPILIVSIAVSGFIISIIWGWVVPDVFSGAVALKLLPANLSLWHSILLSFLFSILGLSSHRPIKRSSDKK